MIKSVGRRGYFCWIMNINLARVSESVLHRSYWVVCFLHARLPRVHLGSKKIGGCLGPVGPIPCCNCPKKRPNNSINMNFAQCVISPRDLVSVIAISLIGSFIVWSRHCMCLSMGARAWMAQRHHVRQSATLLRHLCLPLPYLWLARYSLWYIAHLIMWAVHKQLFPLPDQWQMCSLQIR